MNIKDIKPGIAIVVDKDILAQDTRSVYPEGLDYDGKHFLLCIGVEDGNSDWVTLTSNPGVNRYEINRRNLSGHWSRNSNYVRCIHMSYRFNNRTVVRAANARIPNYVVHKHVDVVAIEAIQRWRQNRFDRQAKVVEPVVVWKPRRRLTGEAA